MKVLYLYCHPLAGSFHDAIRVHALRGLAAAGHEVDMLDLYAEKFDPVVSAEARANYHDTTRNQAGLETYVERLRRAEALIVQFPTWSFGLPAMAKGFFDRLFMPGVGFDLSDPARARPLLGNIRRLVGVSTYGRPWWMAIYVGDPPRKTITRYVRWFVAKDARVSYLALYHMNVATIAKREAFLARIGNAMRSL